ncbi:MAG TPA: tyrosine-type recombinase/integrase [Acidimicrobiales bacterium]|nr:tyrosine-type recombinase/integrase [Acidimicrobiales bacterium]
MAYIVTRNHRFYVVAYDGIDPLTGRERRRWHPAGASRTDAEAIAATIDAAASPPADAATRSLTLGRFLTEQWMPRRRTQLRATTAHRYEWMIDNYINPRIGDVHLRGLRVEHVDRLYHDLLTGGSRTGGELASKTVYDVHLIIRSSLADAARRSLVGSNVALLARAPRAQPRARCGPETWTAGQLRDYLDSAAHLRLYPALHVAATTGMRRGELAGLRWGDWQRDTHRISIARSRQVVGGKSVEVAVKTRTSRRCIDLDPKTEEILGRWFRQQRRDGGPVGLGDPIFTNGVGCAVHPESTSQLFDRHLARTVIPRIRFHDLRHTHTSLLVAAGTPIKVVSERLGHAHPGFTMATYQHLIPGMSATAALDFANMIAAAPRDDGR